MKNLLITTAKAYDVEITPSQADQFIKYMELLLEWNEKINLTAITEPSEVVLKHFVDCVQVIPYLKKYGIKGRMIDVGTGAGFPSIPIKIVEPELQMTLLDSLEKRIKFLSNVIDELQLKDIELVHGRAEDIGREKAYRESFDFSVARAVANLPVLLEYCTPFVKVGGSFVAMKGQAGREELQNAKNSIEKLGCKKKCIEEYEFSEINSKRSIVIVDKIRQCPPQYPRKAGTPSKKPL